MDIVHANKRYKISVQCPPPEFSGLYACPICTELEPGEKVRVQFTFKPTQSYDDMFTNEVQKNGSSEGLSSNTEDDDGEKNNNDAGEGGDGVDGSGEKKVDKDNNKPVVQDGGNNEVPHSVSSIQEMKRESMKKGENVGSV